MTYHMTSDGPKPCAAKVRACPIGGIHFDTFAEAEVAFAEQFEEAGLNSIKQNASGEVSASISADYGHWSIIEDHLHNAAAMGNEAELLYYSSPQGRLELARRSRSRYNKDYLAIAEKIETAAINFAYSIDQDKVTELAHLGKLEMMKDSSKLELEQSDLSRENDNLRHYLVQQSKSWLKRLTPEQQEAISWLTSNGFGMVQHAIKAPSEMPMSFEGIVDENSIWDKHPNNYDEAEREIENAKDAYAKVYLDVVLDAMKQAPQFAEETVIARGTSINELKDILGVEDTKNSKELFDKLEAGDFNGRKASKSSRLSKIPLSATASPRTAIGFGKMLWDREVNEDREVLIAIKARTSASPVNVSAWGSAEFEVLTNPHSTYEVVGGRRSPNGSFILELEEIR